LSSSPSARVLQQQQHLPQQRRQTRPYSRTAAAASNDDAPSQPYTDEASFVVPLFPLSKTIKLPGDDLTLNLYEERYLALADWIMDATRNDDDDDNNNTESLLPTTEDPPVGLFGALYAADKPQMVSDRGWGPIVPMLRPGDVGVLVVLTQEPQDAMIPTAGSGERRRVRLQGTAVARFVIQEMLQNGHGNNNAKEASLPFMLARVRLYVDDDEEEEEAIPTGRRSPAGGGDRSPSTRLVACATSLGIPLRVVQRELVRFGEAASLTDVAARRAALVSRVHNPRAMGSSTTRLD
jgi:hypothetical protein